MPPNDKRLKRYKGQSKFLIARSKYRCIHTHTSHPEPPFDKRFEIYDVTPVMNRFAAEQYVVFPAIKQQRFVYLDVLRGENALCTMPVNRSFAIMNR